MYQLISPAIRLILPFCLLTTCSLVAHASKVPQPGRRAINLSLDYEGARAVLDALSGKTVSNEQLSKIVRLEGTQALIRQAARFDKDATDEMFRLSLKRVVETGSSEKDPFRFMRVRQRLPQTRALLDQIAKDPRGLTDAVVERMLWYAPEGLKMNVRVVLIAGGTSDGFAPSSDSFYTAVDYFQDDYEGLKLLMAHELFHNAQAAIRRETGIDKERAGEPLNVTRSLILLLNTLKEGTASVVGDPLEVRGGKAYIEWFRSKYRKNLDRIEANFTLFEALLYRSYHDPEADVSKLYGIGFSGLYDSPLYFVGYRMARIIEKYNGRQAVVASLSESPAHFFNLYIETYRKHDDPEIIRFSKQCEVILQGLAR